jgi:putative endonuclease
LAVLWLRLRGYRILARNFRTPVGEIDIVARRRAVLCLVEVKARDEVANALQAISPRQRERISRAASAFLQQNPSCFGLDLRFDAVLVAPWRLPRHLKSAWRPMT